MIKDALTIAAYATLHHGYSIAPSGHYTGFSIMGFLWYLSFLFTFMAIVFGGDLK